MNDETSEVTGRNRSLSGNDIHWKKDLSLFLGGQGLSVFGSALVQYAIVWHITLNTKSGIILMLSVACSFLPAFILSPIAGVCADRWNRKRLVVFSDAFVAVVTLGVALLFMAGSGSILVLLIAQTLRSAGSAFQTPAIGAILPQIVPKEKLLRANGINSSIQSAIHVLSPMAGGALLTLAPIHMVFFVDVATAALAISTLVLFLHVPSHGHALKPAKVGFFIEFKEGFAYLGAHSSQLLLFVYYGLVLFLITPSAALTRLLVVRVFGEEVWRLSTMDMVSSIGMVAGGILIATWGGFRNRRMTILAASAILGTCALMIGLVQDYVQIVIVMAVFGMSLPLFSTPFAVLIQENVEEAFHGRMFSLLNMFSKGIIPIGMLVFGPLSELVRIEVLLIVSGLLLVLLVLIALVTMHRNSGCETPVKEWWFKRKKSGKNRT